MGMETTECRLIEAAENDRLRMRSELAQVVSLRERLCSFQIDLGHAAFVSVPWLVFCVLGRCWWLLTIWIAVAVLYGLLRLWQRRLEAHRDLLNT